ncbi:hypothetical protein OROMI_023323 [Orobanche minor]
MAHQQHDSYTNEKLYKATWSHRAWYATGCTTVLISLAKSWILISKPPSTRRTWVDFTFAALLAYLLADLVSGIFHWAADNYGSAQTPFFGTRIETFRAHHQHPSDITKYETARIVYTMAAVNTIVVTPFCVFSDNPVLLGFIGVFAGCSMFSIKFHIWAHLPKKKLPPLATALQAAGILIRQSQHIPHHRPPYNSTYCTVSGICNRVLDEWKVFVGMEAALFYLTGVRPRSWSEPVCEWIPKTQMVNDDETQCLLNSKNK